MAGAEQERDWRREGGSIRHAEGLNALVGMGIFSRNRWRVLSRGVIGSGRGLKDDSVEGIL